MMGDTGIGVGAGGSGRAVAPPGTRANSFSGQMLRFSGQMDQLAKILKHDISKENLEKKR